MAVSDVRSAADAVRAFLEHLIDPMLPAKLIDPSPSQQKKVAQQMHSIVLLYNYYHRKQHPELEFLVFNEFCKLAVALRPTLLAHMKFMRKPDNTELVNVEEQLSLTEKAIMNASDICTSLNASKNIPNIEGWPISKVVVLLVDSKKDNCFLLFSSITEGVWSVIEKSVDTSSQISEVTSGTTHTQKKRRVIKKPAKNERNVDEDVFLQLGYSAVKEAAGVNGIDIMLLQSHTVYSQSKERTASRFYIMKCSQSINQVQGFIQVPIKDLIKSFRGPLIERSSTSWVATSVVEYFHVLPYSEIISEWISRETFSNSLQDSKLAENNGHRTITRSGSLKETQDMIVDKSLVFPSENRKGCQHTVNILQVSEDQDIENLSVQHRSNGSTRLTKAEKVHSTRKLVTEDGIKGQSAFDRNGANTTFKNDSIEEYTRIENNSNTDLEKFQMFIASKREILTQTAINAFTQMRNSLTLQHRQIEDKIAVYDKKIQRLIGGEDDFELMIEGCNDTLVRNRERMSQHLENQCLPSFTKRKRLSEAVLSLQSPCQELDDICQINNWILPTYRLSLSDGGFESNVTVEGVDFECSCGGNSCSHPLEARESAAAQMLTKLRSMAKAAQ